MNSKIIRALQKYTELSTNNINTLIREACKKYLGA